MVPEQPKNDGKFKVGHPGGPGRKPGSRNKLGEAFVTAMLDNFQKYGIETIETVRVTEPAVYIKTIAQILPKEHTGEDGEPLFSGITVNFVK